jgi:hypothetical protein
MQHTTQPKGPKDYRLKKAAQQEWIKLTKTPLDYDDCEAAVRRFMAEHPEQVPEAFEDSGRARRRLAWESLRGRTRDGECVGGTLGRLRVEAGQPLELRRINLVELGISANLKKDPHYQFLRESVQETFDALQKHVRKFVGVLERGRDSLDNHVHAFVPQGSCKLGVSNGIVPDSELVQRAEYLMKRPEWNPHNATAYLQVKVCFYGGADVTSRISHRGLGNKRTNPITLQDIELAVGFSLAKPQAKSTLSKKELVVAESLDLPSTDIIQPKLGTKIQGKLGTKISEASILKLGHVGSKETELLAPDPELLKQAQLPLLRDATARDLELVGRLHHAWQLRLFDKEPGKIGAGKARDLGKALGYYFDRKWLSSGEVGDLVQLALQLGLDNTSTLPKTTTLNTGAAA